MRTILIIAALFTIGILATEWEIHNSSRPGCFYFCMPQAECMPACPPATPPVPTQPGNGTMFPPVTIAPATTLPATTIPATTQAPTLPPSSGGSCAVFYALQHFNLFCFKDVRVNASDCEGRVAAGGALAMTDFSVGLQLRNLNTTQNICSPASNSSNITSALDVLAYPNAVECGGDANLNRGRVNGGFALITGQRTVNEVSFSQGCEVKNQAGLDFAVWRTFALEMSRQFNAKSATGTATLNGNALALAGTQTFVEVFDLFIEDLASIQTVTANINRNIAAVIVNLKSRAASQAVVRFPSISYAAFQPIASKLMWNAFEIRNISLSGAALYGTLLAPECHIDANDGQFNGFVWSESWSGNMQINVLSNELFCWPLLANLTSSATTAAPAATTAAPARRRSFKLF